MNKPRVLVVYQHLAHYRRAVFLEMGKSEAISYEFAADADALDPTIAVMSPGDLTLFHELSNLSLGPFLWQRRLLRTLGRRRFHAVILLGDYRYLSTWLAAMWCRITGVPVLMWTHGWTQMESGFRRRIRLGFYRLSRGLLVYGVEAKRIGSRLGYPGHLIHVVYNSQSSVLELPMEPALRDGTAHSGRLLFIGRLTKRKRVDLILDALRELQDWDMPLTVDIIGEGPERESLERRAQRLGVVATFHGAVYASENVSSLLERADLLVIPGHAGLSVLQGLAAGVPVLTHDDLSAHAPEVEAITPGLTGDFFPYGDAVALSRLIRSWIGRTEADRQASAEAALNMVRSRYTAEAQVALIDRAVAQLCVDKFDGKVRQ